MVRSQLLNYRTLCKSWMGMFREEVLVTVYTPPQNDKKHGYKFINSTRRLNELK